MKVRAVDVKVGQCLRIGDDHKVRVSETHYSGPAHTLEGGHITVCFTNGHSVIVPAEHRFERIATHPMGSPVDETARETTWDRLVQLPGVDLIGGRRRHVQVRYVTSDTSGQTWTLYELHIVNPDESMDYMGTEGSHEAMRWLCGDD